METEGKELVNVECDIFTVEEYKIMYDAICSIPIAINNPLFGKTLTLKDKIEKSFVKLQDRLVSKENNAK